VALFGRGFDSPRIDNLKHTMFIYSVDLLTINLQRKTRRINRSGKGNHKLSDESLFDCLIVDFSIVR